MTTITIEQAGKHDGQEVTVQGWLYNLRESGKLLFPLFRVRLLMELPEHGTQQLLITIILVCTLLLQGLGNVLHQQHLQ